MSEQPSRQVVFDETLMDVFFAMAFQEGLLEADDMKTDGVFRRYRTMNPPDYLKRMVLEQTVLSPTILKMSGYPIDWLSGEIIEKDLIKDVAKVSDDELLVDKISTDIIIAMLEAKNIQITESDILQIVNEVNKALERSAEYEKRTGREALSGTRLGMRGLFGQVFEFDDYSDEDMQFFEAQQAIYNKAQPIANVINEYERVQTTAQQHEALIRIPTTFTPNAPLISPIKPHEAEQEIAIVRIASTKLGRLTYKPTLRESLELAQHDTTVEFYRQLVRWKTTINEGNLDAVEVIHADVERASKELSKVAETDNANRIVTYASLPIALIELLPIPSIMGFTTTITGFLSTAKNDATNKKYKWAMFGDK